MFAFFIITPQTTHTIMTADWSRFAVPGNNTHQSVPQKMNEKEDIEMLSERSVHSDEHCQTSPVVLSATNRTLSPYVKTASPTNRSHQPKRLSPLPDRTYPERPSAPLAATTTRSSELTMSALSCAYCTATGVDFEWRRDRMGKPLCGKCCMALRRRLNPRFVVSISSSLSSSLLSWFYPIQLTIVPSSRPTTLNLVILQLARSQSHPALSPNTVLPRSNNPTLTTHTQLPRDSPLNATSRFRA